MKWVIDTSGRFQFRPYYEAEELDAECERITAAFLEAKYKARRFPISTDDLTVMVEQHTSDLDLYADLSREGEDVEGLTDFFARKKPVVRISRQLSTDPARSQRLRTTLAHEYGHVRFHKFLWDTTIPDIPQAGFAQKLSRQRQQFLRFRDRLAASENPAAHQPVSYTPSPRPPRKRYNTGPRCHRTFIFDAPVFDWMEWQASYACSALLMPAAEVRAAMKNYLPIDKSAVLLPIASSESAGLIAHIAGAFDVSPEAARIRLTRLGIILPAKADIQLT
jgi:hypothetical protein